MKNYLHGLRNVFWLFLLLFMWLHSPQKVQAVAIIIDEQRLDLDYGATIVFEAGSFYDMTNNEGMDSPTSRHIALQLPPCFQLKSLLINGREHKGINQDIPADGLWTSTENYLQALFVPDWVKDQMHLNIVLEVEPITITSPEILASILNVYQKGTAHVEGSTVVLDQSLKSEKTLPHIIDLRSESMVIDFNEKELQLSTLYIESGDVRLTNGRGISSTEQPFIIQNGGNLTLDNWNGYRYGNTSELLNNPLIELKGGYLSIEHTQIDSKIVVDGERAVAEMKSGKIERAGSYPNPSIEVKSGQFQVTDGIIHGLVLMNGGSLTVSGGFFDTYGIEVASPSSITLSGGYFSQVSAMIRYHDSVEIPTSSTLLADNVVFGEEFLNMCLSLGTDLPIGTPQVEVGDGNGGYKLLEGKGYGGFSYIKPLSAMQKTVAFEAAEKADVGPEGTDVKANGTTLEILTPAGLAWLAVESNTSGLDDRFTNGNELFNMGVPEGEMKKVLIKNDLDMSDYGEGWPSIMIEQNMLIDGEGHHISNMNLTGAKPMFIDNISQGGILMNLIVEGSVSLFEEQPRYEQRYDYNHLGGLVLSNAGQIVNCGFNGNIRSEVAGEYSGVGGLVYYNEGTIENCFVNPCGGQIQVLRKKNAVIPSKTFLEQDEEYYLANIAVANCGIVENCYFGGKLSFENEWLNNPKIQGFYNQNIYDNGSFIHCYESEATVDLLNENVENHEQNDQTPWAHWAIHPDKGCGMPYLSFDEAGSVTIRGEKEYEDKHYQANIVLEKGAVYTINQSDAVLANLTIKEGAQLKLNRPLTVMGDIVVERYIETDKWTTICSPIHMRIVNNDVINGIYGEEELWSKVGFSGPNEQYWKDYGTINIVQQRAHLMVARYSSQMGYFKSEKDLNAENEPITLGPKRNIMFPNNQENANLLVFLANPLWENISVEGKAYVLNEEGTAFELEENPTIPPFHCYMFADEYVTNQLKSLRISDTATELEKLLSNDVCVWTEDRNLCIQANLPMNIMVYSAKGTLMTTLKNHVGTERMSLPQGAYFVICGDRLFKVVL